MEHVPAWKKIAITAKQTSTDDQDSALNVTTHLATGSLSKREKRSIIRGDTPGSSQGATKKRKRDKAPRDQRRAGKELVLRDQLRYLIDFYRERVGDLPSEVWEHEPVCEHVTKPSPEESASAAAEKTVMTAWKFSKQKQNWLLKHVLDTAVIPMCYNTLLVAYLRDMQGRSRDVLLQTLRDHVDGVQNDDPPAASVESDAAAEESKHEEAEQDKASGDEKDDNDDDNDATGQPDAPSLVRARLLLEQLAQGG